MSILDSVVKGKVIKPLALLIHAVHGIGKTTLGAAAPSPIFVGSEENDEVDTSRLPKVKTWRELEEQLKGVRDDEHNYKSLVLDTIDSLQQVAEQAILSGDNKSKTMATAFGGYGKAYAKMAKMFLDLRDDYLIPIRENRKMNIILLCHSSKVKHEEVMTMTSYDHYETSMHKKVAPIFNDWVSAIFFMNYQLVKYQDDNSGKEYAVSINDQRMIYTEERPSHIAKNRFSLPYEIPFEFDKEKKTTPTFDLIRTLIKKHYTTGMAKVNKKPVEVVANVEVEVKTDVKVEVVDAEPMISVEADQFIQAIEEKLGKMENLKSVEKIRKAYHKAEGDLTELERINVKLEKLV